MFPPPQIPNRYDDDEQRLRRLEAQEQASRRRSLFLALCGAILLAALIPLSIKGWSGAGVILAPIGIGLVLAAGIQLVLARLGD